MSRGIRVLVNGAKGRMGSEAAKAVSGASGLVLAAATDLGDDLAAAVRSSKAQVVRPRGRSGAASASAATECGLKDISATSPG